MYEIPVNSGINFPPQLMIIEDFGQQQLLFLFFGSSHISMMGDGLGHLNKGFKVVDLIANGMTYDI